MSFARPPRNFTLALFLFDSRKGPSTRSLPLPFSLIQTPKPENPNPRLKTAKEPPKVKIISFFFLFSFFSLLLSHSLEETWLSSDELPAYINKTGDKNSRKWKTVIAVILICTVHAATRNFSPPLFFLSLSSSSFFFPPSSPSPFSFYAKQRVGNESSASAQSSRPCYLPRRGIQPGKNVCFSRRVCVVYVRGLHKSPSWTVYTGKKGNGSGLGTCNFDKATCMSNWPRFIKLSLLSLLFPLPA